jgi:hypothetical protein
MNSMLNPNASDFASTYSAIHNPMLETIERLERCNISRKDYYLFYPLLPEWFSSSTINSVLKNWEEHNIVNSTKINTHTNPFDLYLI